MADKVVARNPKASHDFFLQEKYEAGLALQGSEIKAIRAGQISLKEAYVLQVLIQSGSLYTQIFFGN